MSSSNAGPPEPALRRPRPRSAAALSGPPPGVAHRRAGADPLVPLLDLPGVAAAVASSRESVDRLRAHRVLRRQSAAVTAEATLRGARASAALEGVHVSLAELRAGRPEGADPVIRGVLRISVGLGGMVDTWPRAPRQVLARLHLLAAAGTADRAALGRPSAAAETSARLAVLATLVAGGTAVPAVVLAAIVHGELRVLSPFGWGDGLVARAAARLTMISSGLDPTSVTVPEVGHWELRADYDAALAGYATGTEPGLAAWLRHCCAAVELGAREGLAVCEAIRRG